MPRACQICGSRKWHKDSITSSAVCEEGHVLQGHRTETAIAEPTPYALQRRTIRRERKKSKKQEDRRNLHYYHGDQAEYLKYQAIQLLLRHQVAALTKLWQLPDIFECQMIVRDLWAYRLAQVALPTPDDVLDDLGRAPAVDKETDGGASSDMHDGAAHDDTRDNAEEKEDAVEDVLMDDGLDGKSDATETGSARPARSASPDFLAALSQSSGSASSTRTVTAPARRPTRRRLRASDTLTTLLMALWYLRIPVLHADFEWVVNENRIPFVDFGRTTLLPKDMRKHANRDVMLALCPPRCPTPMSMFAAMRAFARLLARRHQVVLPEVNYPPVAWRIISALGGRADTYARVTALLALLELNLHPHPASYTTFTRRSRTGTSTVTRARKYNDVLMPDLAIAAAWVIVMKLLYGLDGAERIALSTEDPAIGLPQRTFYLDELRRRVKDGSLKGGRAMLETLTFASMKDDDIDRFLDSAEAALLSHRDVYNSITPLFPMDEPDSNVTPLPVRPSWAAFHAEAETHKMQAAAGPLPPTDREMPAMPGENLRSYDPNDLTGTLPDDYDVVLTAAADVVGVTARDLGECIRTLERRLEKTRPRTKYRLAQTASDSDSSVADVDLEDDEQAA